MALAMNTAALPLGDPRVPKLVEQLQAEAAFLSACLNELRSGGVEPGGPFERTLLRRP
ncbi:MAG: hypothetical protein IT462_11545 [Planctomycetes bacterium]|nr:hypothetical protein [Planctomycetota bacterium]